MKIIYKDKVIAESEDTIAIEGNQYFPAGSVRMEFLSNSDLHTTCVWKGEASYYNIDMDGETLFNAAWYYPQPKEGSVDRVGKDFANYVAFYLANGVELVP